MWGGGTYRSTSILVIKISEKWSLRTGQLEVTATSLTLPAGHKGITFVTGPYRPWGKDYSCLQTSQTQREGAGPTELPCKAGGRASLQEKNHLCQLRSGTTGFQTCKEKKLKNSQGKRKGEEQMKAQWQENQTTKAKGKKSKPERAHGSLRSTKMSLQESPDTLKLINGIYVPFSWCVPWNQYQNVI